jgi:molybdenum cofactor cytidylyltransferase
MLSSDQSPLHTIVLAAGASTRFGAPKQLAPLDGQPILRAVVDRAIKASSRRVVVVLGAHASDIAPVLRSSPASVVLNQDWKEGLASSIRVGMAQLPESCAGVMLLLGDQPAISVADLTRLSETWGRHPDHIVAAQYACTMGAPAIFPRMMFAALRQLHGDHGAKELLWTRPERVVGVALARAALDVDVTGDLIALSTTVNQEL